MATKTQVEKAAYAFGFHDPENYVFKSRKGLDSKIVSEISWIKDEPQWMRDFRLLRPTTAIEAEHLLGASLTQLVAREGE